MKAHLYSIAVPILAAVGFAQDTPPAKPQPASTLPAATKPQEKTEITAQSADRMKEMKTQTYSGTLVEASCAGAGSDSKATAPASPANPAVGSADRTAGNSPGCGLSSGASQFALRMKDGQTVRFDDVGNARAQEAIKNHKKWAESASANKPVRVKVSGVLNGDKMTVLSVD